MSRGEAIYMNCRGAREALRGVMDEEALLLSEVKLVHGNGLQCKVHLSGSRSASQESEQSFMHGGPYPHAFLQQPILHETMT